MDAHELFSAGKLQEAVEAQTATVKSAPGDQAARLFLFELLAFAGLWDRAQRQLDAIHYDDIELSAALESYKQIMAAETARRRLFAEGVQPKFLVDPPEHVRDRLAALNSLRLKQPAEAAKLLDAAADKSAVLTGQLNGKPFDVLADCDDLFGNVLEVFAQGSYYWVPLENVELVAINPPRFPRDLLWAPARLELHEGTAGQVFLPSIYPGSSEHADEQVKLGRMTDWLQEGDGPVLGKGLRMFLVGEETHTLLDWRELNLTRRALKRMAKSLAIETALMPSILDRLLDPDSGGTLGNRGYGLEKMVAAVRRDLEEVLNTRRSIITLPEEYPELIVSPLNFGLPDFGSIPTATHQQHDAIGDMVAEAISLFEPRLRDVRVHLVQEPTAGSQQLSLRFQIEARLRMDPFPDVSFETVLELTTGLASIKAAKS